MTNLDSIFKSRDITFPTKVRLIKAMVFPKSWTIKKAVPPGLRVPCPPPLPHRGSLPAGWAGGRGRGVLQARVRDRGVAGRPRRTLSGGGGGRGGGPGGPGGRGAGGACLSRLSHASEHVCVPSAPADGGREDGTRASMWPLRSPLLQKQRKEKNFFKKKAEHRRIDAFKL